MSFALSSRFGSPTDLCKLSPTTKPTSSLSTRRHPGFATTPPNTQHRFTCDWCAGCSRSSSPYSHSSAYSSTFPTNLPVRAPPCSLCTLCHYFAPVSVFHRRLPSRSLHTTLALHGIGLIVAHACRFLERVDDIWPAHRSRQYAYLDRLGWSDSRSGGSQDTRNARLTTTRSRRKRAG